MEKGATYAGGGGSPIYSGLRKPEPCTALGTCTQYFVAQELNEFMQSAVHSSRCLTPLFSGRRCQRGPPPVTAAGRAPGQPRALHFIRQQPTVSLRAEVRPLPEIESAGLGWLATQRFQTEVGHKDLPNQWEKRVSPSPPPNTFALTASLEQYLAQHLGIPLQPFHCAIQLPN